MWRESAHSNTRRHGRALSMIDFMTYKRPHSPSFGASPTLSRVISFAPNACALWIVFGSKIRCQKKSI